MILFVGGTSTLTPTRAEVWARYDNGKPFITEAKTGSGSAVVLGAQASLMCCLAGQTEMEKLIVACALGERESPYRCEGALVYRRAAPTADHYFLVNDGPAQSVSLETRFSYSALCDAVSGQSLEIGAPIELEAYSARWLRFGKA